jgi:hypothetical protein
MTAPAEHVRVVHAIVRRDGRGFRATAMAPGDISATGGTEEAALAALSLALDSQPPSQEASP